MEASDDLLIPYRIRTVRVGVEATVLVLVALFAFGQAPGHGEMNFLAYHLLLLAAAIGVFIVALLPWQKLFQQGWGMRVMYSWSVLDILLITFVVASTGGEKSSLWVLYALTTVFFAASYAPGVQWTMLGFTFACYVGVLAAAGWDVSVSVLLAGLVTLGTVAYMAAHLSRELMRQMVAHGAARAESDARSASMTEVAKAGRAMTSLDTRRVLESVVDAVTHMSFDATGIAMFDHRYESCLVAHHKGMPRLHVESVHEASSGMYGEVLSKRKTIIENDYANSGLSSDDLKKDGHKIAVAVPIWVQGRLAGVMWAGRRGGTAVSVHETEALELLAAQGGLALENAARFEQERRTVERLAELDRLKSDFMSTVSHEIRTPLTVIEGMGMTLQQRAADLSEEMREVLLQRLNENARALDRVITNLLEFTRMESGKLQLRMERVDLTALLHRVVARLSPLLQDHSFHEDLGGRIEVSADASLMERVMENLISNAVKHTPKGTRIVLSAHTIDSQVTVSISDEGPGIPRSEQAHLGERFFRGGDPTTRSTRGMGLGLALVKEILGLHGSSLDIESQVGVGSRFSFALPSDSYDAGSSQETLEEAAPRRSF